MKSSSRISPYAGMVRENSTKRALSSRLPSALTTKSFILLDAMAFGSAMTVSGRLRMISLSSTRYVVLILMIQ